VQHKRLVIISAVAATGMFLTACSSGGGGASNAGDSTGGGKLTPISMGVTATADSAPLWLGVQQGIFEKHGIDLKLEKAQGGAAILPAVLSGDEQFGQVSIPSIVIARDKGIDLSLISPLDYTTGDPKSDSAGIFVMPNSGIHSLTDLAGKTVASNTLANVGDLTMRAAVDQAGGDSSTMHLVEMNFPDMIPALKNGSIDAAWLGEPFCVLAQQQGIVNLAYHLPSLNPEYLIAGVMTSGAYAKRAPDVVAGFTAAMTESLDYAEQHPDEARAVLSTYTEIAPDVQAAMVMPRFLSTTNKESVQLVADLALKQGFVKKPVDVAAMLP
jgi:NitT/TauT family transport system substrate-binding protein